MDQNGPYRTTSSPLDEVAPGPYQENQLRMVSIIPRLVGFEPGELVFDL